jgi:hypothetical protein
MGISRRIRNIARTQINAIKDRLDRIDSDEPEGRLDRIRDEASARRELAEASGPPPALRTPEEIAAGHLAPVESTVASANAGFSTGLARHYRVLGLEPGADLEEVEVKYAELSKRCDPSRFPEGSTEHETAKGILARVEHSYREIREELDPTSGRFDKLEL